MKQNVKVVLSLLLIGCLTASAMGPVVLAMDTPSSVGAESASESTEEAASQVADAIDDVAASANITSKEEPASSLPQENPVSSEVAKEQGEIPLALDANMNLLADSTGVRGFVERLYNLVMSRGSDTVGINYWTGLLTSGEKTAAQVAQFFFNSEEFLKKSLSDDDYLAILYRTMMGREPDGGGMAYWKDYLNSGLSRNFVLHNFVVLPEFTGICQQYGVTRGDFDLTEARDKNIELTRFISRLYKNCMGRTADAGGLNFWAECLQAKQKNGASIVNYFFTCDEFNAKKLNDEDFLRTAYRTLFGREAEQDGFAYWMGIFSKGYSRRYILNQFIILEEFTKACQVAGIERGSLTLTPADSPAQTAGGKLTVIRGKDTITDDACNILPRVVAAEVGGLRNDESFKAQAIAAHSYILVQNAAGKAPSVPDAEPTQRIKDVVAEVVNTVVMYDGKPALTTYYASNSGTTNSSEAFWGKAYPYLVAVPSPHDVDSTGYMVTKTITRSTFIDIMDSVYGRTAALQQVYDTQDPATWIQIPPCGSSGYPTQKVMISVCGRTPNVEYFYQNIAKIRSAAFTVQFDAATDSFTFTTYGYGHGVGMSQWGAYFFAVREGWNYQQILAHYYPGTTLGSVA